MYDYRYEDVAWQRLKDLQREMENRRLMAEGIKQSLASVRLLAQRAWLLAGLATRRPPRANPPEYIEAEGKEGCVWTEVA
jgi:hypothetical protein